MKYGKGRRDEIFCLCATVCKTKNKTIGNKLFFLTLQTEQAKDLNFILENIPTISVKFTI